MNMTSRGSSAKAICKDALDKVLAINTVKSSIDDLAGEMQEIASPLKGLFTTREYKTLVSSFNAFKSSVDGVLDRKFLESGMMVNDCIKRDLLDLRSSLPGSGSSATRGAAGEFVQ